MLSKEKVEEQIQRLKEKRDALIVQIRATETAISVLQQIVDLTDEEFEAKGKPQ